MFDAEFSAIGKIWESVLKQGALFFDTHFADINNSQCKWYLLIFSAVMVYGFVKLLVKRRKR